MLIYAISYEATSSDGAPAGVSSKLLRSLKPHSTPVVTLAVDDTGTLVATGSADGVIKIWDILGGFVTHTLKGHEGIISALRFIQLPGAQEDVAGQSKRAKGRRASTTGNGNHTSSSDRLMLVSGVDDGQMRVWDLQSKKAIAKLSTHTSVVRALDYSPEHGLLLSGSRDETLVFWDTKRWKVVKTNPVLDSVEAAGFIRLEDGILLTYCGGEDGRLRVWMYDGPELILDAAVPKRDASIVNILRAPAQQHLYVIYDDQSIVILNTGRQLSAANDTATLPSLRYVSTLFGSHDEVIDMAYVPSTDGERTELAIATNGNEIRIIKLSDRRRGDAGVEDEMQIDAEASEPPQLALEAGAEVLSGHTDIVLCLSVDYAGGLLATGSKDNTAKIWSLQNGSWKLLHTVTGHTASIGAIALSQPAHHTETASRATYHPFLLTGSQDSTIKKWSWQPRGPALKPAKPSTAKGMYTRLAHEKDINALSIDSRSELFATASQDRTVKIWSVEDGEAQGILRGHKRGVWTVAFAPSTVESFAAGQGNTVSGRNLVLTGSGDKTVKLWSLSDYSCLRTFEGHTNSVLKAIWLPAEKLDARGKSDQGLNVASAGGDGLVKIWSLQTGECVTTLDNHTDRVWTLAVRPDPRNNSNGEGHGDTAPAKTSPHILTSGSADSTITFWLNTTAATHATALAHEAAHVERTQHLANHIAAANYREAIVLALTLDHPAQLLDLFTRVAATTAPDPGSHTGKAAVDEVLRSLDDPQLYALLVRVRDWNANARHAAVAQRILACLVRAYPEARFQALQRAARKGGFGGGTAGKGRAGAQGVRELLLQIGAYTERHYKRMEELIDESWVVDWLLMEMDGMGLGGTAGAGVAANGRIGGAMFGRQQKEGRGFLSLAGTEGAEGMEVEGRDVPKVHVNGKQNGKMHGRWVDMVGVNGNSTVDHPKDSESEDGGGGSSDGSWHGIEGDVVMAS